MRRFLIALLYVLCFDTGNGYAHPVSFKDGFGVMPEYSADRSDLELNYSVTAASAVGVSSIYAETESGSTSYILPRFNYRLYRRNELESQTNLYLSSGVGTSLRGERAGVAGLVALQGDFETRRIYTLLNLETIPSARFADLNRIRSRFGMAPYLAGFNELNTWLIVQVDYATAMENHWTVSPLVRLFYSNYLFEFGVSLRGEPSVAGIFHF